jgi:hypothetical protein
LHLRARGEGGCLFECRLPFAGGGLTPPTAQVPEAQQ